MDKTNEFSNNRDINNQKQQLFLSLFKSTNVEQQVILLNELVNDKSKLKNLNTGDVVTLFDYLTPQGQNIYLSVFDKEDEFLLKYITLGAYDTPSVFTLVEVVDDEEE